MDELEVGVAEALRMATMDVLTAEEALSTLCRSIGVRRPDGHSRRGLEDGVDLVVRLCNGDWLPLQVTRTWSAAAQKLEAGKRWAKKGLSSVQLGCPGLVVGEIASHEALMAISSLVDFGLWEGASRGVVWSLPSDPVTRLRARKMREQVPVSKKLPRWFEANKGDVQTRRSLIGRIREAASC